jgi:hypothetical protein
MKKISILSLACVTVAALVFFACSKKSTDDTIKPTYKDAATGTGGNPNAGNATQTGSVPITNPASENSSLNCGGAGWNNPSCASSGSLTLQGVSGSVKVTLSFNQIPVSGNYNVSNVSGPSNVQVVVENAPGQPSGVTWYGKQNGGVVSVNSSSASINATFSGIQCVQSNFNFPVVSVSGNVGCN